MSQPIRGQGGYLVFLISPKNASLVEDVEILLSIKFCWILFSGFRRKVKNVSANHRPGVHFVFPILLKNTNLVEGVEILLPIKFCWILFSGFREVENVSANQRPGRPFDFSDRPEKHKLGRGRWDLASYQVSLNSVQQFQRRSRKCLSQSEARRQSCFSDRPEKHKLGRGRWDLSSCQVSSNSFQRFQRRSRKCLSQSEAGAAILFFAIGPKNTNLVEGFKILLPIKFRWIQFSGFRGEVENVSANPWFPQIMTNHFQRLFKDFWVSFSRTFQGFFLVPSTIDSRKNRQYWLFN